MHKNSIPVNNYTFPFILKSLAELRLLKEGEIVHGRIIIWGHLGDIYVGNSLLNLYASCGVMRSCLQMFDEMLLKDVVSWTVMIKAYNEAGKHDDALIMFERMRGERVVPNRVTMVNALAACAGFGGLEMGVWIHEFIERSGWELDVILGTSLIDMYGKCGRIESGLLVFDKMGEKNLFTWNAVIKGLALAKNGKEAVSWFLRMEQEGFNPDEVTLIAVLCACVHSGLVHIGRQVFSLSITGKYGFSPSVKHYACMVDLLARAGFLEEALRMSRGMPFEPTRSIWGALLAGGRANGSLEISELAAHKLVELEPGNSAYYIVLANLYAEMGRWNDMEKVRELMKERGFKKDLGRSTIEAEHQDDKLHNLLA